MPTRPLMRHHGEDGSRRQVAGGVRVRAGTGRDVAADLPVGLGVSELVAEAALLQARLDWFQTQLARFGESGERAR